MIAEFGLAALWLAAALAALQLFAGSMSVSGKNAGLTAVVRPAAILQGLLALVSFAALGASMYNNCIACHGDKGQGPPVAMTPPMAPVLAGWRDGPGMIIDESDGSLSDLPPSSSYNNFGIFRKVDFKPVRFFLRNANQNLHRANIPSIQLAQGA